MAKLSHFPPVEYKPLSLMLLEREREAPNLLPDILRDLDFKPRRVVVEEKRLTLPFGVSFSRTRIVIDE